MGLDEGDVIEAEVFNEEYLKDSKAEEQGFTIMLDESVEEGVHQIKITEVGINFAFATTTGENP